MSKAVCQWHMAQSGYKRKGERQDTCKEPPEAPYMLCAAHRAERLASIRANPERPVMTKIRYVVRNDDGPLYA